MLRTEILAIMSMLESDIPDFYMVHPNTQESIAEWITECIKPTELAKIKKSYKTKVS